MAIAVDTTSLTGPLDNPDPITFSHTTGSLNNGIIVVAIQTRNSLNTVYADVQSVTYNGVNLTKITSVHTAGSRYLTSELWYLINPNAGTHDIEITFNNTPSLAAAGAITLSGAKNVSPINTFEENSSSSGVPSVSLTTSVDNVWIIDSVYSAADTNLTPGASQTQIYQTTTSNNDRAAMSRKGPITPAGATSMTWTNSDEFVSVAAAISPSSAPTVTTSAATNITGNSATGNGNVTSDGGATVTERGFVYGTSANPTTSGDKVVVSGTTGAYTGDITGLLSSTLYHYRAYAINSVGTSYGADTEFTTDAATVPTVVNGVASQITKNSVLVTGNVTSAGGSSITERGFVISLSATPTINDTKYPVGGSTGVFSLLIKKLKPKTTYYVRAYAINSSGVSYG